MTTALLWAALAAYGLTMFLVSPRARTAGSFFSGRDESGRSVGLGLLVGSIVISWLFAKSITNAANLGAKFGIVGSVAYAGWYFSIPVVGGVLYAIRRRTNVRSLGDFVTSKYGRLATAGFTLVIMVRLFNEIWSNSAVVGAYFGESQSLAYYAGALVFTATTLAYSLRGGLRSSIFTDGVQMLLAVFLVVFVLGLVVPESGLGNIVASGEWTLAGGVDLLVVGVLQSLSYGFHDPVLTDRAFITDAKSMLKGYLLAGLIAGGFIVVFGFVGVHGSLAGIETGQDSPLRVAEAFGISTLVVMSIIMMVSAGSTLDSTLSSFSRAFVVDLGGVHEDGDAQPVSERLTQWLQKADRVTVGRATMVVTVILGTLPLFAGAAILKATTISGTMVLGLAPVFLLFAWRSAGAFAFHFALWPGVALGIAYAAGAIPESWAIGDGAYAVLLGANVYGTVLVFVTFALGALFDRFFARTRKAAAATLLMASIIPASAYAQSAPPADLEPEVRSFNEQPKLEMSPIAFSGQTMLRLTTKLDDISRPSAEVYNVRLVGTASYDDFSFLVEPRFRQSNLRSFSPSNVWLQQAYAKWNMPVEGLSISGGLLYDQVGLFWDGSWFGNLPYLNGHKLDPDMNLEVAYNRDWGEFGIDSWLQVSPAADGLDGTFFTDPKAELLQLPPDPETLPAHREALSVRARVVPSLDVGPLTIRPGGSVQLSVIDRTTVILGDGTTIGATTGAQRVIGAELTFEFSRVRLFGEYLSETLTDLSPDDLTRQYVLAGAGVDLLARDSVWLRKISLNSSFQTAEYVPEQMSESFLTAQIHLRLNKLIGFTTEYVTWQIPVLGDNRAVVNRIEWILHVYY